MSLYPFYRESQFADKNDLKDLKNKISLCYVQRVHVLLCTYIESPLMSTRSIFYPVLHRDDWFVAFWPPPLAAAASPCPLLLEPLLGPHISIFWLNSVRRTDSELPLELFGVKLSQMYLKLCWQCNIDIGIGQLQYSGLQFIHPQRDYSTSNFG